MNIIFWQIYCLLFANFLPVQRYNTGYTSLTYIYIHDTILTNTEHLNYELESEY